MPEPEPSEPLTRMNAGQRLAPGGMFEDLSSFATSNGFTITSGKGGKHNPGSKHYEGLAIDVRTRDKTPEQVNALIAAAQAKGYRVLDERQRPKGQGVWSGPHLHIEAASAAKPQTKAQPPKPDPARRKIENALAGQQERLKGLHPLFDYKEHRAVNDDISRLQKKLAGIPEPKEFFDNLGKQSREARSRVKNFVPTTNAPSLKRAAAMRQELAGQRKRLVGLMSGTGGSKEEIKKVTDRIIFLEDEIGEHRSVATLSAPLPPLTPETYPQWAKRATDLAEEARRTARAAAKNPTPENIQRDKDLRQVYRNVLDAMGDLTKFAVSNPGLEAKRRGEARKDEVNFLRSTGSNPFAAGVIGVANGLLGAVQATAEFAGEKIGGETGWGSAVEDLTHTTGVMGEGLMPENAGMLDQVIAAGGSMAAFMATTVAGGGILRAFGVAGKALGWSKALIYGATEAGADSGGTYAAMIEQGFSPVEARAAAQKHFLLEILPNIALAKWALPWEAKGLTGILNNALPETIQEGWQMGSQNIATGRPWSEGIGDAALIGGLAALLFSAPAGILSMRRAGATPAQIKEVDDFLKQQVQSVVAIVPVPGTDVQGYDARPERPADPVTPMTEIEGTAPKVLAKALSNEKGEPIVVYHGGRKQFSSTSEMNFPNDQYTVGAFFTSDQATAGRFGKEITPATVHFTKPFVVDAKGAQYNDIRTPKEMKGWVHESMDTVETDNIAEYAIKHGYDGAIIKNVVEGFSGAVSGPAAIEGYGDTTDVYIAFGPEGVRTVAEMEQANQPIAAPESVVETPVAIAQGARSEAPSVQTSQDVQAQEVGTAQRGELPGERIEPPTDEYPFNRYRFGRELPQVTKKVTDLIGRAEQAIGTIRDSGSSYKGPAKYIEEGLRLGIYEAQEGEYRTNYALSEQGRRLRDAIAESKTYRPFEWRKPNTGKIRYADLEVPTWGGLGVGEVDGKTWWTDSHQAYKGKLPKGAKPAEGDRGGKMPIARVIPDITKEGMEELVPYATTGHESIPQVILKGTISGELYFINDHYYDVAMDQAPGAKFVGNTPDRAVAVVKGNEAVGVIMPMRGPEFTGTSLDDVIAQKIADEDNVAEPQTDFKKSTAAEPRTRKTIDAESSGIATNFRKVVRGLGIPVFELNRKGAAGFYQHQNEVFSQGRIGISSTELENASVIGHEAAHALGNYLATLDWRAKNPKGAQFGEWKSIPESIKAHEIFFGTTPERAKILDVQLRTLTFRLLEAQVGTSKATEVMAKNGRYYNAPKELQARFMESLVYAPWLVQEHAQTALDLMQQQAKAHPVIQDMLDAAAGDAIENKLTFMLWPDRRQNLLKSHGEYLGQKIWNADRLAIFNIRRDVAVIRDVIEAKFENVKDDPQLLFNAAEAILSNSGGEITFGTKDVVTLGENEDATETRLVFSGFKPRLSAEPVVKTGEPVPQVWERVRWTPEEGKALFDKLSPEGKQLIREYTEDLSEAKDLFNRNLFKSVMNLEGKVEGYVHHYFDPADKKRGSGRGMFGRKKAAMQMRRLYKEGFTRDLKKAVEEGATEATAKAHWNELVNRQIARMAEPLHPGDAVDVGNVTIVGNPKTGYVLARPDDKGTRWQIPKRSYQRYIERKLFVEEEILPVLDVLNKASNFWAKSILANPGTVARNTVSGAIQLSNKWFNDLFLDALDGKATRTVANMSAAAETLTPNGWRKSPDWLTGGKFNTSAGQLVYNPLDVRGDKPGIMDHAQYPRNQTELYFKKVIALAEQKASGGKELSDTDLMMQIDRVIDRYAYNYDNIHDYLEVLRRVPGSAVIKPFATWGFKHTKQVFEMLGTPFDRAKPIKERVAGVMTLALYVSAITAWKVASHLNLDEDDNEKGFDVLPNDQMLRTSWIPFVSWFEVAEGAFTLNPEASREGMREIFGGLGPLGETAADFGLGFVSDFDKYKTPSTRLTETGASFIPFGRTLGDVADLFDEEKRPQPRNPKEAVAEQLPLFGAWRNKLRGEYDKASSKEKRNINRRIMKFFGIDIAPNPGKTSGGGGEERTIEPRR